MAKQSYVKLGLKMDTSVKTITWMNGEEAIEVEVKQYLPLEEKLQVIGNIVNNTIDDNDFYNPVRLEIFTTLEIVYAYTNLNITAKMKEDPFKLYDAIVSTGFYDAILGAMCTEEFDRIDVSAHATIRNLYNYKNSALGILATIASDYSSLDLDAEAIRSKIGDPANLELLRNVLTKLG